MSISRKESERTKLIQEKCQNLLTQMLRDEDNKYCVDCDAKGPRWASWNIGVFLCIRCAGIHRNLGVHISRVKSVNLDSWTPEQVVSLQQMGNSRARAVYEAQLPDGYRRPQNDSMLESFIRAKYEHKKYVAREWVPPSPPKVDWNKEIEEELERQKRKKKSSSSSSTVLSVSSPAGEKKSTSTVKTPLPAPLPKPKTNSSSPKSSKIDINNSSGSSDLLGLSTTSFTLNSSTQSSSSQDGNKLLNNDSNDLFSNFLSAPPLPSASSANTSLVSDSVNKIDNEAADTLAKQEADFFNQTISNDKEKGKLTNDSILALYSATPANNLNNPQLGGYGSMFPTPQPNPFMQIRMPQQQNIPVHANIPGGIPLSILSYVRYMEQTNQQQMTEPINPGTINYAIRSPLNNLQQTSTNNTTGSNLNQQFGNMNLNNSWQ